ncbi:MAG: polymorphic toxin type 23 domain-containing protein [Sphaerochaetaceae bacterium]|nr:polymorphic toxin type 23 domain-containing protein [Sphaerochaetaceae bacterium]MDC7248027.1 polymorphic toxin type 23 domain-containing protein [Sphaerochaetaceae bacterium]
MKGVSIFLIILILSFSQGVFSSENCSTVFLRNHEKEQDSPIFSFPCGACLSIPENLPEDSMIFPVEGEISVIFANIVEPSSKINVEIHSTLDDFTTTMGAALTYHPNFYGLDIHGLESKLNLGLSYESNGFGFEIGTNFWNGLGSFTEFKQQTGKVRLLAKGFFISYENDGFPFCFLYLGDGYDSFRTCTVEVGYENVSLELSLFTGKRTTGITFREGEMYNPCIGRFGEHYMNEWVEEESRPYRFSSIICNIDGVPINGHDYSIGVGVCSEWIRHFTQNMIHEMRGLPEFQMMDDDFAIIIGIHSSPHCFRIL